jgi:hypothetical protein
MRKKKVPGDFSTIIPPHDGRPGEGDGRPPRSDTTRSHLTQGNPTLPRLAPGELGASAAPFPAGLTDRGNTPIMTRRA